jgi:hypothetical protein
MLDMEINVYTIYIVPLWVRAQYNRLCPISGSLRYNGSLVAWTVVCLTVAKFKPLMLSMSGFALSNIANIFIVNVLEWLLLVACIILSYSHKRTVNGKPWIVLLCTAPYISIGNHGECLLPGCCHGNMLIEPLPINGLNATVRCCGNVCLTSHWLAMDFHSGSIIPTFRLMSQYMHRSSGLLFVIMKRNTT